MAKDEAEFIRNEGICPACAGRPAPPNPKRGHRIVTYREGRYSMIRLSHGEYVFLTIASSGISLYRGAFWGLAMNPWGHLATWKPHELDSFLRLFGGIEHGSPFRFMVNKIASFWNVHFLFEYIQQPQRDAELVAAFAARLEESQNEKVLDARRLPFPKFEIRGAIQRQTCHFQRRIQKEPSNELLNAHLSSLRSISGFVASYQEIDLADEVFVAIANEGRLEPRQELLLILKYHQRAMKECGESVENPLEPTDTHVSFETLCTRFGIYSEN